MNGNIKYKIKKFLKIPYCAYMCIKYPFLYPRSRFTDLHYNNWKISNFAFIIYKKYCVDKFGGQSKMDNWRFSEIEISEFKKDLYYFEQISPRFIRGWKNWWAKPIWLIVKFYHNYILQFFHCLPTYTEWDRVEPGWNNAFGKQYLNEIKTQLKKDKCLYTWRITDIKEKWGRFQLYCNWGSKELYNIIDKYENLSWNICIKCGKHATHTSRGWICPYCKECAQDVGGYGCIERTENNHDGYDEI